jgi:hypothetical protein
LAVTLPFLDGLASYCSRLTAAALPISVLILPLCGSGQTLLCGACFSISLHKLAASRLVGSIAITIATVTATATFDLTNLDTDPVSLSFWIANFLSTSALGFALNSSNFDTRNHIQTRP